MKTQCVAIQYFDDITGDYHDFVQLKDGMTVEQFVDEFNHIVNCINEHNEPFEVEKKKIQDQTRKWLSKVIVAEEKYGKGSPEVINLYKEKEKISKIFSEVLNNIVNIDIPFIVTQMGCSYPLGTKQLPEIVLLEDDTLSI